VVQIDLSDKVAIVTGGSRGIGRAISIALAQAGANVNIIYASKEDAALETRGEIAQLGGNAEIYKCNVADEKMVEETLKKLLINLVKLISL